MVVQGSRSPRETLADTVRSGLSVASVIACMVHDLVRDAIADVIGKVASKVAIGVLTAGLAAPWAVTSVTADVSSWVTRLSKDIADTVLSAKNLKNLLERSSRLLNHTGEKFGGMGMVDTALNHNPRSIDNTADGFEHLDDAAEATENVAKRGGDEGVPPKDSRDTIGPQGSRPMRRLSLQEPHERAQEAKISQLKTDNEIFFQPHQDLHQTAQGLPYIMSAA